MINLNLVLLNGPFICLKFKLIAASNVLQIDSFRLNCCKLFLICLSGFQVGTWVFGT